jgi:hypothetical protein
MKHNGRRPKLSLKEKQKRRLHRERTGRKKPDPRHKKVPGGRRI